jgi:phospholipid/cholesterol/gamma-HCH transport system substrate-binding protein
MEIRARYILMGVFLLAVIAGVFGFVYWLENSAGFHDRTMYRIRFDSPVSGLLTGSPVLFNGIRVGEVKALRIRSDRPKEVAVDIAVDAGTPIRDNTKVDLEYQGLTGVAAIALNGGDEGNPINTTEGDMPTLMARQGAGTTITQAARDALVKLNGVLDDNSRPIHELISNLNEFAGALAKNSGKVDGILSGLERMTGGAKGPDSDKVYDVVAPKDFTEPVKQLKGQVSVPLPTAIFQVDTQNIIFRQTDSDAPLPAGPRWSDNLTRLLQARIAQTFENAGYGASFSQNADVTGDYKLLIDIRTFQIVLSPKPTAEVSFSAKITDANGKILAAKIFGVNEAAASGEPAQAVAAINEAFASAARDLVAWSVDALAGAPEPTKSGEMAMPPEPGAPPAPDATSEANAPAEPAMPDAGNEAKAPAEPAAPSPSGEAKAPAEPATPPAAGEAKAPDAPADGTVPAVR